VVEVRRALHIRTGQRAAADALDAWLVQHQVESVPFGDVYEACVHLLQNYERVPDVVLVGADWLSDDELNIVRYVRQTWSGAAIIIYGSAPDTPRVDVLPLVLTCRGERGLRTLLDGTPAELVRRLAESVGPIESPTAAIPARPATTAPRPIPPPDAAGLRANLISDEISTVFDPTDDG
jgi:hypothetical protein